MVTQLKRSLPTIVTIAAIALIVIAATRLMGQSSGGQLPRIDGKPNLSGIWQAMNTAHWDLEAQGGGPAPKQAFEMGAVGAIPPGIGVVVGGRIPYKPEMLARREENRKVWPTLDPEVRCYLPGIPRATYLPYPFQIFQNQDRIVFTYQYSYARRIVNMGAPIEAPIDTWMGWQNGRWDGNTLVVENTAFIDPPVLRPNEPAIGSWLDRTGNFHSSALKVTERFTPIDATHLDYEATLEDPNVYTRPWTIKMPLYKRMEPDAAILEFKCPEYVEELYWGPYRKQTTTQGTN
jgi:hypothetical protein